MHITLIATDIYGPAVGTRFISAALKREGFATRIIFLQGEITRENAYEREAVYSDLIHDEIAQIATGSQFVGISVLTPTFHKAREVTQRLRERIDVPIIWGGYHVMAKPEECLEYADILCFGEGEDVAVQLAQHIKDQKPYTGIRGLVFRGTPANERFCIAADIEHLPIPDYSADGTHYVLPSSSVGMGKQQKERRIEQITKIKYSWGWGAHYSLTVTRGCPYQCTYCINSLYNEMKGGMKKFRQRKFENVMDELEQAKKTVPFVVVEDDCFMAVDERKIEEFTIEYKKRIGLPFVVAGVHPNVVTAKKLDLLCDAGMVALRMGIQTGSDKIQTMYNRQRETNQQILSIATLFNRYIRQGKMESVVYDFILNNPWEEEADRLATRELYLTLPSPFHVISYDLTFYPGTPLYRRALTEGLIKGDPTDPAYYKDFLFPNERSCPIKKIMLLNFSLPLSRTLRRIMWPSTNRIILRKFSSFLSSLFLICLFFFPEVVLIANPFAAMSSEIWTMNSKIPKKMGQSRLVYLVTFLPRLFLLIFFRRKINARTKVI